MDEASKLLIGKGEQPQYLYLPLANRHGLVAGATGTGKTITLQVLAEGLSRAGVPVFCADVKGDLSGISRPGSRQAKLEQRAAELGVDRLRHQAAPVIFWDVFGQQGHPVRATVAEMGPLLLARMLELNDDQEGVLNIAFKLADDQGLLLLDFKDLTAILQSSGRERRRARPQPTAMSARPPIGTIQRRLLTLEQQGREQLLRRAGAGAGRPDATDAGRAGRRQRAGGRQADPVARGSTPPSCSGCCRSCSRSCRRSGDLDKPKLVFFFDEAHLLFDDAPKALIEKVEQVVRLIRSKGVGVYFVTQNPADMPRDGARASSATGCSTRCAPTRPREQKGVRAAADAFRANPAFKTAET